MTELEKAITLPLEYVERLLDLAATAPGNASVPDLMMFSEVRRELEQVKAMGRE
jgi:hypothetical protein